VRTIAAVGPNWFACLIRIWGHVKLLNIIAHNVQLVARQPKGSVGHGAWAPTAGEDQRVLGHLFTPDYA